MPDRGEPHANQITSEPSASNLIPSNLMLTVICPKHGEHQHAIVSDKPGHEGAWCQLCWLESLGPSLPYRKRVAIGSDSD